MQLISLNEVQTSNNPIWFKAITTTGVDLVFSVIPFPAIKYNGDWYKVEYNKTIVAFDGMIFGIDSDNYFIMEEAVVS